jgi:hypothetical protein
MYAALAAAGAIAYHIALVSAFRDGKAEASLRLIPIDELGGAVGGRGRLANERGCKL